MIAIATHSIQRLSFAQALVADEIVYTLIGLRVGDSRASTLRFTARTQTIMQPELGKRTTLTEEFSKFL